MFLQSVVGSPTSLPSVLHVLFHTRLARHSYMALTMLPVIYRTELSRGGVERCFLSGWHLLYGTDIIYNVRSLVHHHAIIHGISFRGFNTIRLFNTKWSPLWVSYSDLTHPITHASCYTSPLQRKKNMHEYGIDEQFSSKSFTVSGNTAISVVMCMCKQATRCPAPFWDLKDVSQVVILKTHRWTTADVYAMLKASSNSKDYSLSSSNNTTTVYALSGSGYIKH